MLGPGGVQVDRGPGCSLPSSLLPSPLVSWEAQEPLNGMLFCFNQPELVSGAFN